MVIVVAFSQGDEIIMILPVTDSDGVPIEGATVEVAVLGPASVNLTSNPTDMDGVTEVAWATDAPNKKGNGGTPVGSYTAALSGVLANGYTWDGQANAVTFILQ